MAAEKKPRAAKAETKTTKTTATKTTATKAAATKPRVVRARKPKVAAAITAEQVAERAYYIWAEGSGDDPFANWLRAERELTTA